MGSSSIWHWIIVIAVIAAIVFAVRKTVRMNRDNNGEIIGIGGWLILVIVGLIGTILLTLGALAEGFSAENFAGIRFVFSEDAGEYSRLRMPLIFSTAAGVLVITSAGFLLNAIFSRNTHIRMYALVHYLLLAFAGFVDYLAYISLLAVSPEIGEDPSISAEAIRGIFIAAIWVPYFFISKRVRNTFSANKTWTGSPSQ